MKKAVQFGAGNIGRGFIGALLSEAGYHVTFADVVQEVIDKINAVQTYTVHIMDMISEEIPISNISGVSSTSSEVVEEIASADLVTTAVGLTVLPRIAPAIAKAIEARRSQMNESYLNIIACENAIRASSQLKASVYDALSEQGRAYADVYVGFPDCAVDRIVPPVKSENFIDVIVERYHEWDVEREGFRGEIPVIDGMHVVDNLMAYVERKLFTLNTAHCITAYLGTLSGYHTIEEAISAPEIFKIVHGAMQESGEGLIQKHGFDAQAHANYIEKIIARFKNPHLQDDVTRVGRQPLRKLSPSDRLIAPLTTARSYGVQTPNLICGIAAALHFDCPEDEQSVQLQQMLAQNGVRATVQSVTEITEESLLDAIVEAYDNL